MPRPKSRGGRELVTETFKGLVRDTLERRD